MVSMVSIGLQLLLVVIVLSSDVHAEPLLAGRERLPRDTDRAQRDQHPPPFSVDTFDEAVVSLLL